MSNDLVLIVALFGSWAIVVGATLTVYRRLGWVYLAIKKLKEAQRKDYAQIEAYISLLAGINPLAPLPVTRGFAASPDFLKKTYELVKSMTPAIVVEASSGISTLVTAYGLMSLGKGQVVSLEHDAKYAIQTRARVKDHRLSDIATVVDAPLKEFIIEERRWLWYDISALDALPDAIDLLIIDGPPKSVGHLARYPAMPLLFDKLRSGATIILDDADREDEQEIVRLWLAQFPQLSAEYLAFEKGCYVLSKA